MADWTNIANATIEPDAPLISSTMFALRDNPKALAEGAAGAPRVENAAIADDAVDDRTLGGGATNVGRNWVLARTALAVTGTVGTYALLNTPGTQNPGDTQSGSLLTYASAGVYPVSASPSGTWRCMGASNQDDATYEDRRTTLWLRIS